MVTKKKYFNNYKVTNSYYNLDIEGYNLQIHRMTYIKRLLGKKKGHENIDLSLESLSTKNGRNKSIWYASAFLIKLLAPLFFTSRNYHR